MSRPCGFAEQRRGGHPRAAAAQLGGGEAAKPRNLERENVLIASTSWARSPGS